MGGSTWRAVEQPDGDYRLVGDDLPEDVDETETYSPAEVTRLASDHGAEVRWVASEGADRRGDSAREATASEDPWGGTIPPA